MELHGHADDGAQLLKAEVGRQLSRLTSSVNTVSPHDGGCLRKEVKAIASREPIRDAHVYLAVPSLILARCRSKGKGSLESIDLIFVGALRISRGACFSLSRSCFRFGFHPPFLSISTTCPDPDIL